MEKNSSVGAKPWSHHPLHHHHHHFQIVHNCPLHSYMLQRNKHVPPCPLFTPFPLPQNPEQITPSLQPEVMNMQISEPNVSFNDSGNRCKVNSDFCAYVVCQRKLKRGAYFCPYR
uniref:Uncharacterized protein n=1 Tax=Solanum lycopersicum TaxID=4081 RepID=A0A3Q7H4S8_SOLLC